MNQDLDAFTNGLLTQQHDIAQEASYAYYLRTDFFAE
jgi:hypothetical protein